MYNYILCIFLHNNSELETILGKRHNINPTVTRDDMGIHILKTKTCNR